MRGLEVTVGAQLHGELAKHVLGGHLHVETQSARIEAVRISQHVLKADGERIRTSRRIGDERSWIRHHPVLRVDAEKEMGPIAHDRPPERRPVLRGGEVSHLPPGGVLAHQDAVRKRAEHRSAHRVGARLRDGVHHAARGGAMADIERHRDHLDLFERLQGYGPG